MRKRCTTVMALRDSTRSSAFQSRCHVSVVYVASDECELQLSGGRRADATRLFNGSKGNWMDTRLSTHCFRVCQATGGADVESERQAVTLRWGSNLGESDADRLTHNPQHQDHIRSRLIQHLLERRGAPTKIWQGMATGRRRRRR